MHTADRVTTAACSRVSEATGRSSIDPSSSARAVSSVNHAALASAREMLACNTRAAAEAVEGVAEREALLQQARAAEER